VPDKYIDPMEKQRAIGQLTIKPEP